MLVQTIITIGAILAVIGIVLGFVLLKMTGGEGYVPYYPSALLTLAGIVFACIAAPMDVMVREVGLGGWAIAALFAAGISFIVTSVSHAFQIHDNEA
ncbi:hypothetical protein H8S33_12835 [Ornithinibacillus sp. BX22]|uniref:Uncharacterized protein n=2 Tax=Ornithinibacillus TaxID=484508 RepID=A0A923L758_9BACI|nr:MULTISPECIES: hypothetical protein [Ornithinibacillus]MBC5637694.1 hypothetical protein [Ornithinibacillus hominis]MBS3681630.1 hypothetical protein [Ornithinibacillus massiliensis]